MTQAFNLSQLANKVNTSGNLDASTGLYNQVPVANGGTGKSTVTSGALLIGAGTSAMTELVGSTPGQGVIWNGTTFVTGTVSGAADGINTFVAPGTWTKPSGLLQVKVTVIGAGGAGGNAGATPNAVTNTGGGGGGGGAAIRWIPAVTIPGPVAVTAGAGTNSFGAFASATAGAAGVSGGGNQPGSGGAGGVGSSGTLNISGQGGGGGSIGAASVGFGSSGTGGSSILGGGGRGISVAPLGVSNGQAGGNYGGGGSGATKNGTSSGATGGAGAPGIVIVEEFY
jgi:hypothetical protein